MSRLSRGRKLLRAQIEPIAAFSASRPGSVAADSRLEVDVHSALVTVKKWVVASIYDLQSLAEIPAFRKQRLG
jgi:hypothetical protein